MNLLWEEFSSTSDKGICSNLLGKSREQQQKKQQLKKAEQQTDTSNETETDQKTVKDTFLN